MLKSMKKYPQQDLADRLVAAMDQAGVNLADMARACGVTIQAVYSWRETGRIGKQHLITICRLTKKPLEYFLVGLHRAALVLLAAAPAMLLPAPEAKAATFNIKLTHYTLAARRWLTTLLLSPYRIIQIT